MAQFSSVTYGSQFKPYAATNTQQYGSRYPQIAASLAGLGGQIPGVQVAGQTTTLPYTYDPTLTPSTSVTNANAPVSTFDPTAGASVPNTPGGPSMSDLQTDPILQQIAAAGTRAVQDARSAAMRNAENALIGYGSTSVPDAVRSAYAGDNTDPILAALTDANTAQAAAANPDSTLMRLQNQNTNNVANLNQRENLANLYYSSTRGNDLGTLANQYRSAQNDAAASLAGLLGNQEQGVLTTEQQAQANYLNALQGAWDRWMGLHPPGTPPGPTTPPPTTPQTQRTTGGNDFGPWLPTNPNNGLYYWPRTLTTV